MQAIGLCAYVNWVANLIVSITSLTVMHELGEVVCFSMYACICFFSIFFIFLNVVETKGRTFLQIKEALRGDFKGLRF